MPSLSLYTSITSRFRYVSTQVERKRKCIARKESYLYVQDSYSVQAFWRSRQFVLGCAIKECEASSTKLR